MSFYVMDIKTSEVFPVPSQVGVNILVKGGNYEEASKIPEKEVEVKTNIEDLITETEKVEVVETEVAVEAKVEAVEVKESEPVKIVKKKRVRPARARK